MLYAKTMNEALMFIIDNKYEIFKEERFKKSQIQIETQELSEIQKNPEI